ncbi:carbamoyl-phosphate synthase (glutamine-hydrolyzing) cpa2 [Coemansia thaxteri]|nr:carbamoyl-phosphate synthase (glutamine-hydrolyzing) cpa2 [Coemansia thaxteri]
MDVATPDGRRVFITLLVNWSLCDSVQLGRDLTTSRVPGMDWWQIECPDDDPDSNSDSGSNKETDSRVGCYYFQNVVYWAERLFGRHTRCFAATDVEPTKEAEAAGELKPKFVVKDAWPVADEDVIKDSCDEVLMLKQIKKALSVSSSKDFIYSKIAVGGRVSMTVDKTIVEDNTDNLYKGVNFPPKIKVPCRVHRRIVTSPVGESIYEIDSVKELILVVGDVMRCHSAIVSECKILHRDISDNNILAVRQPDGSVRGLLVDFDCALDLSKERIPMLGEKTGTLPFMSINNLSGSYVKRTSLDDWESMLYLLCFYGTMGIDKVTRRSSKELENLPIEQWKSHCAITISHSKYRFLDNSKAFMEEIVSNFNSKDKDGDMLKKLTMNLARASALAKGVVASSAATVAGGSGRKWMGGSMLGRIQQVQDRKLSSASLLKPTTANYVGRRGFSSAQVHYEQQQQKNKQALSNSAVELASGLARTGAKLDVKKVLVVGSGGLSIGQAGEFDYSGSQAIKALKESQIETVLVNPNIATVQTSHELADHVYFAPVTPQYLAQIIEKERPDGIMLAFGGQTALNCGVQLEKMGVLAKFGVRVLGTSVRTLELSEDRDLFASALKDIGIPVAQSVAVETVADALQAAGEIGYPVIVRSAYALGGLGSGFAGDAAELAGLASQSLALCPQILVEKSMRGWKEVEYEVVRDAQDNCVTVCNMENFDPLGVHTGDSIVVAPSQTLSDAEYHMLRTAAIKIVRHMGVVGECNVQYALNPHSMEYCVIEMNARLSRSSALASKATGYPLAFVAAKIGLGWTLPELQNSVTTTTTACFEPSLDYVVTKIPRWDLGKFNHVSRAIGSCMKSVGEVMAIGRTFEESLQKAIRSVDPSFAGFAPIAECQPRDDAELEELLRNPTDRRLFYLAHAMINRGYSVDRLHEITRIDRWFLHKLDNICAVHRGLCAPHATLAGLERAQLEAAKRAGFSDKHIGALLARGTDGVVSEDAVRAARLRLGLRPYVKRIDTLAGEFPAPTNYLYTTYNAATDDVTFGDRGTMVLGSGVYRIGSSVEFDWCGVSAIRALRALGHRTVMVNYNPETVSTDFDECDRLYFDELSYERVRDIYDLEQAGGVVVSVGGQLPQNIAQRLHRGGVNVLGTSPDMIDAAEDRHRFSQILDQIGVDQPAWKELRSAADAAAFAESVGYPVLVRPSYVLSGAAMAVAHDAAALQRSLTAAAAVSPDHPVVITKFIQGARELDIDAVAHNGKLLVHAVSEHVEDAGVHSGDASLMLPPRAVDPSTVAKIGDIGARVARAFEISGPFNMQVIMQGDELKVIECNLRASRSFPFVSKVTGTDFVDVATRAIVGQSVPPPRDLMKGSDQWPYTAVKAPQFSWTRLAGADPFLGVEMASTGEVACFGRTPAEAYLVALMSTNAFRLPQPAKAVYVGIDDLTDPLIAQKVARHFAKSGHPILTDSEATRDVLGADIARVVALDYTDRSTLRDAVFDNAIDLVVNLAKRRPSGKEDSNYTMRRMAVDFAIPLVNDQRCAEMLVDALAALPEGTATAAYGSQPLNIQTPVDVRPWRDYLNMRKQID